MKRKNRKFWPHHVIKAGFLMLLTLCIIMTLAYFFRIPTFSMEAVDVIPSSDAGMHIPQPEWYFLLLWLPFWYLTGTLKVWIPVFTFFIPVAFGLTLLLVPFFLRKKESVNKFSIKRILVTVSAISVVLLIVSSTIKTGYQAKIYGCIACHNPTLGVRQAVPPMDVAEFYKVDRQRQIESGRYRAGKRDTAGALSIGEVESYKDANWQLRHAYEPTFTW